jgi:hypothetical protein
MRRIYWISRVSDFLPYELNCVASRILNIFSQDVFREEGAPFLESFSKEQNPLIILDSVTTTGKPAKLIKSLNRNQIALNIPQTAMQGNSINRNFVLSTKGFLL